MNRMTDRCKNITFATSLRTVISVKTTNTNPCLCLREACEGESLD